jgi:hypothetical protein
MSTHPVDESSLRVEQIKLVVETSPGSCDSKVSQMPLLLKTHEVVLDNMHKDRETLARSPPGTRAGGSLQIPSWARQCNPVAAKRNSP